MKWISTKIKFPESGEQVLTACKNMNMKDGIWLYDLCRYYPNVGWENRVNWEEILYWKYIDKPKEERIMEQYIPKSALVAEIERIKDEEIGIGLNAYEMGKEIGKAEMCDKFLSFLDTLEVKEVDLDVIQRMKECPYRQVGCTMYEGTILECRGACSWVVDYLKLKEYKAQKGEEV